MKLLIRSAPMQGERSYPAAHWIAARLRRSQ
jgi:hypothetical protein